MAKKSLITKWYPKAVIAAARAESKKNVMRAVIYARDQCKILLNKGGGGSPSPPGEPPHKQSADLFRSITGEVIDTPKGVNGAIGTNMPYGRRLELGFHGTDSMGRAYEQEPRPYLKPAVVNNKEQIRKILKGKA